MKSRVQLDVDLPQAELAALFTDPANNPKWMDDVAKVVPIRGKLGHPGSVYRMVPRKGKRTFVATVIERNLPTDATLSLEAPRITAEVVGKFRRLTDERTRLVSEETFYFQGVIGKLMGWMGRHAIHAAHRRQMESFKRFAEGRERPGRTPAGR